MKEMTPEEAANYRRWRLEKAPEEIAQMLKEEEEAFRTKFAKVLTMKGRVRIKGKNFALPTGGPKGTGKYPIHDEQHAKSALTFVARHGSPEEKTKVYSAVAAKYPGLSTRSSVGAVREKVAAKPIFDANDIPWYPTAAGATAGTLLGQKLRNRKTMGQVGGAVLGTGVGLVGGKLLARKLINRQKKASVTSSMALELIKQASVDLYVDKSDDMDRGMFAERDFEPGEVIEIAPVLVVPRSQIKDGDVLRNYVFNFDEKNVMVALGYASMFNHSYKPNARYKKDKGSRTLTFTAIKPIKAGEEIFVNYNLYPDDKTKLWFDVKEKQTEKVAVTTAQLAEGAKRMRKIRTPGMTSLFGENVAGMAGVPPYHRVRKVMREAINVHAPEVERLYGPEIGQSVLKTVKEMAAATRQASGRIIATPGGTVRSVQRLGPRYGVHMPKLSPKEQKSFNLIGMAHESAEVGVPKNPIKLTTGHADPSVLMKEHNLLARAEDAPLQGAAEAMRSIRARPGGEVDFMHNLMEAAYPGRPFEYGKGEKITKAMRKDLRRRLLPEIAPEMERKALKKMEALDYGKVASMRMVLEEMA
jgi:hypothetical protein